MITFFFRGSLEWRRTYLISYFDLLQTAQRSEVNAKEMSYYVGKQVRMTGILVTTKYVRTVKGEIMQFGTFQEAVGGFLIRCTFRRPYSSGHLKAGGLPAL